MTAPESLETPEDPKVPLRRVAALFVPYRWWIAAIVLAAAAQGIAGVVSPFLLREILDVALPERSASLVSWLAAGMIVAALATAGLGVLSTYLANVVGQHVMHDLRVAVFAHLQSMSLRFFTRARAGEVQSRLANDIGGVDSVITTTANGTVQSVFAAGAVAAAALVMNWRLGLLCLLVVPLFLLLTFRLGSTRRRITRGRARLQAGLAALVEENLSVAGVLLTKSMGRGQAVVERFARESRELAATEQELALVGRWRMSSRRAALTMIPAVVYWVAGLALAHGAEPFSIGTAVAFTSMLNRLVAPATSLQGIGTAVSTSMALFGRIFGVLDLPAEIVERPGARSLARVRGEVRFDHVGFAYDPAGPPTLTDVSFTVAPGTTTALVGATGAGKTTLAYLVTRLYDADSGAVRIDGTDVRDLSTRTLTDAVGLVAQETHLLHDTVRENLRFAVPDATDAEIEAAARAARIHDLVAGLPQGYDTVVGARGYRFSGGERQRLAIARMLLRNPPVLVLDEATSALDTRTERQVQAALAALAEGRTTLAIAHRLSTVRNADQIVVLDHGRVVECGTHDELLGKGGHYARLARDLAS